MIELNNILTSTVTGAASVLLLLSVVSGSTPSTTVCFQSMFVYAVFTLIFGLLTCSVGDRSDYVSEAFRSDSK